MDLLPNFSPGPLDRYRKIASFDWRKMRVFLETEEIIEYKKSLVDKLEKSPLFRTPKKTPNLDEIRHNALLKMHYMQMVPETDFVNILDNLKKPWALIEVMFQADGAFWIKHSINRGMFTSVVHSLGTEVHLPLIEDVLQGKAIGCFCLTEIGHGTNTKGMLTRATFKPETQEYVIHSPNFEAAKCWAGLLGQLATHALVYAQLYTPDGVCHGLHQFVVPIRDRTTMRPYAGVTVGDMGEKIGLNGTDNGYLMFDNYHVSRTALLNKNGEVTPEGKYITPFKDPSKRFGAALATLSSGRVNITTICNAHLMKGISIAIRYAAVRKQFGPDGEEEIPILEYQTHQHRLLPYLAGAYVFKVFTAYLMHAYYKFTINQMTRVKLDNDAEFGIEMHAVSSACKPAAGWFTRDGLQECREACAGHGYLKASRIGDIRNDHDANCTYEGENHVLIQQTSNWLLKLWPEVMQGKMVNYPMGSVNFLNHAKEILTHKLCADNSQQIARPECIIRIYQWLTCYLLKITYEKHEESLVRGKGTFWTKNNNQVFYARNLGVAYIQHFFLQKFFEQINTCDDPHMKNVLIRLFGLYGLFCLEKHIGHLYQGGLFVGEKPAQMVQNGILELCLALKDDAIALVDSIAPCDFLMNSILGKSDGQVYKHLKESFKDCEEELSRPEWWKDITNTDSFKSKL